MTEYPKISVIIPMYNAAKTIRSCIRSVLSLDYPHFETIVVDDASKDNGVSIVSDLPCKLLILDKNYGPGVVRNKGAEVSTGEIIAFTDADCEVPKDWLRKIVEDFEKYDIAATSGGYSKSNRNGFIALFQFYDTSFRQRKTPQYINSCITSNFACRKEIFERLGGFPARYINEDMEFGIALSEKFRILWNKNNGVVHHFNNRLSHYFIEQVLWSESVMKLYLSVPKAISKGNTYSNSEIYGHLLFTGLLCTLPIFWSLTSVFAFFSIILLYFIMNIKFIKFVSEKEGVIFSLKIFSFLPVRNIAWLLGIVKAVCEHPGRMLWRSKLII